MGEHFLECGASASARNVNQPDLAYWLALWRIHGVGPAFFQRILKAGMGPKAVFDLSFTKLKNLGFSQKAIEELQGFSQSDPDNKVYRGVQTDLEWVRSAPYHHVVRCCDPDYPPLLKAIPDYPPLLFVSGDPGLLVMPQLAVVGSRNASRQGLANARSFAAHLAKNHFLPTSGLALGIDTAAHKGALENDSPTIAVLAHGLNKLYPAQNKALAKSIILRGALVSELPIDVSPKAHYFPRRNRIISGLSLGVLVVEAAMKSGSLLTANFALEQGREVFAVPGSIHNPLAKGCHALIQQGAKLVQSVDDIVEELAPLIEFQRGESHPKVVDKLLRPKQQDFTREVEEASELEVIELSVEEHSLRNCLSDVPKGVDELMFETGYPVAVVLALISQLELQDLAKSVAGGYVISDC